MTSPSVGWGVWCGERGREGVVGEREREGVVGEREREGVVGEREVGFEEDFEDFLVLSRGGFCEGVRRSDCSGKGLLVESSSL